MNELTKSWKNHIDALRVISSDLEIELERLNAKGVTHHFRMLNNMLTQSEQYLRMLTHDAIMCALEADREAADK